jgi:protein arginine kinase
MPLSDLTTRTSEWMRATGPMHDVVISSRVRLARNIAGMPFLTRCNTPQQMDLLNQLQDKILRLKLGKEVFFVELDSAGDLDRQLLVERHLISRHLADADHPRGVVINGPETVSLMINEEDHLRMQVLRSGLQLNEAYQDIQRIDNDLEAEVDFAFHKQFGYLTACPTNVGTGMRVSVMLHLPALKLTGEIEKAFHAARDMRLAIRGLYGEGTDATGDLFQISNQVTLGLSEEKIVDRFLHEFVPEFLRYERIAREALLRNSRSEIEDRIFRAEAILRSARLIGSEETSYLLSLVRMGVNLEILKEIDLKLINELFLLTQPAHLQKIHTREMGAKQRSAVRADYLRKRLASSS